MPCKHKHYYSFLQDSKTKRCEEEHGSVPICKIGKSLLATSELADLQLEKFISHLAVGQREPWPELGQVSVTVPGLLLSEI